MAAIQVTVTAKIKILAGLPERKPRFFCSTAQKSMFIPGGFEFQNILQAIARTLWRGLLLLLAYCYAARGK